MNKLIAELTRLYLSPGAMSAPALEQQLRGQATHAISLTDGEGLARAMVIAFNKTDTEGEHWALLCEVANALQAELGLPAPAVSISGADGYGLWLSLENAVPAAMVQQFLGLLRKAYFPRMELGADALVELPPCLHQPSGKWAAFINPGLGASFADEAGLEMAPPFAGQAALLESVQSISAAQFQRATTMLQQAHGVAAPASEPAPSTAQGLLLKDATLEDIVRHLHANNIEPTFRHLMPQR
ncbi:hypothetical protein CR105_03225 [Massilia eurypsychrophila]|uniref:Uncharacterized protein n=1 Tax=Massilia eurypsychrophila TaxID=1485217 RepID=A0A2G8TJ98_9BURK|nr:hypothetical protein [Massilia eurypsychrophila]PIL46117.1 hypothetical protein CR105_03225 [Massilia eurypsychrophila]